MNKRMIALIAAGLLIVGAVAYLVIANNEDEQAQTVSQSQEDNDSAPVTDNSQFADPDEVEEPTEEEPQKQNVPSASVSEKPVVFTGFGNSESRPLGLDQTTSTTCTTDAAVECVLTFTNAVTGMVVTFDPLETDATGVARWEWQGADVGSGTWDVVGSAGDKTSDTGTLYIE